MIEMHCQTAPTVAIPAAVATPVRSRTRPAKPPRIRFLVAAQESTPTDFLSNAQVLIRIPVR